MRTSRREGRRTEAKDGSAETLRKWYRQAEAGAGTRSGVTNDESAERRKPWPEVRQLRRAGVLKAAADLVASMPGGRPPAAVLVRFSNEQKSRFRVAADLPRPACK